MFRSLVDDALRDGGFDVAALVDEAVAVGLPAAAERISVPAGLDRERLVAAARDADAAVVVAPETAGVLAARVAAVRAAGGGVVAPGEGFIRLAADKQATIEALAAAGVPGEATVGPFHFEAVPAAHETLECDPSGRLTCLGFLIRVGPWTLYHSGDTVLFPGMEERLRSARIDLAFLPINGRSPERRVAGNLRGREAAGLTHRSGMGSVVPCHYEMFEFNTASPEEFEVHCRSLGQAFHRLRAGERWTLEAHSSP